MRRFWKDSSYLATIFTLGIVFSAVPAHAAIISYDVNVVIDSGLFTGNIYTGDFSYNDAGLVGNSNESLPLTDFNFFFEGSTYTLADDPNATVSFVDGTFVGLDYAIPLPPSPTFISGFTALSEAFFSYDLGGPGLAGTGITTYTLIPSTSVPEPSSLIALSIPLAYLTRKLYRSR